MRIPRPLAWGLILATLFTAGLLRQFHEQTPRSPYVHPIVGSLLFAAVVIVLLAAAREWRVGAVRGVGIRLGSVTPLLLMLLVEKWTSLAVYRPLFYSIVPEDASDAELDAYYVAFAGAGLFLLCALLGQFSRPAGTRAWRMTNPSRFPAATAGAVLVILGAYLILAVLSRLLGGGLTLELPERSSLVYWILGGQMMLAFAEELYYRGLLLSEFQRLAPRLGLRTPAGRRWLALLATSALFAMEHLVVGTPQETARRLLFTFSLGLLFGMFVLLSSNVHFAAAIHAWINWLLLGMAPRFVDGSGAQALPAGAYIGLTLILGCVLSFLIRRYAAARRQRLVERPSV